MRLQTRYIYSSLKWSAGTVVLIFIVNCLSPRSARTREQRTRDQSEIWSVKVFASEESLAPAIHPLPEEACRRATEAIAALLSPAISASHDGA